MKSPRLTLCMILLGMLWHVNLTAGNQQSGAEVTPLEQGQAVEREMEDGQAHSYSISLAAGQYLRATVAQKGIDVVVHLFGPDGEKITEVNSPTGTRGSEVLTVVAPTTGSYLLEIRPFEGGMPADEAVTKSYEVRIEEVLTAEEYTARLEAERARHEAAKQWLRDTAIPLRSVQAGNGFEDLQPLRELIGDAPSRFPRRSDPRYTRILPAQASNARVSGGGAGVHGLRNRGNDARGF